MKSFIDSLSTLKKSFESDRKEKLGHTFYEISEKTQKLYKEIVKSFDGKKITFTNGWEFSNGDLMGYVDGETLEVPSELKVLLSDIGFIVTTIERSFFPSEVVSTLIGELSYTNWQLTKCIKEKGMCAEAFDYCKEIIKSYNSQLLEFKNGVLVLFDEGNANIRYKGKDYAPNWLILKNLEAFKKLYIEAFKDFNLKDPFGMFK